MKNKRITVTFVAFLLIMCLVNMTSPTRAVSFSERRPLKDFKDLDWSNFSPEAVEAVLLDQFSYRDAFRRLKAVFEVAVFSKSDNNHIFTSAGGVYKMEDPLNEASMMHISAYIRDIKERYLQESNVYLSIIPDKTYYLDEGRLKVDYKKLESLLMDELGGIVYIDIKDALDLKAYYRTDPHWKQESLSPVIQLLSGAMGFDEPAFAYEKQVFTPFYGAYYGQAALKTDPDHLTYLVNQTISKAVVDSYENKDHQSVYVTDKLKGLDPYAVFLSGNAPLITITNPQAKTKKDLVIFRDSFASSLAPLLIESYRHITLLDLRFMSKEDLAAYVDFKDKDVLFLYSSLLINKSHLLK